MTKLTPVGERVEPGLMLDLLGVLGPVSLVSLRLLSLVLVSFSTELLRFCREIVTFFEGFEGNVSIWGFEGVRGEGVNSNSF